MQDPGPTRYSLRVSGTVTLVLTSPLVLRDSMNPLSVAERESFRRLVRVPSPGWPWERVSTGSRQAMSLLPEVLLLAELPVMQESRLNSTATLARATL
jgi:hypothetical protein